MKKAIIIPTVLFIYLIVMVVLGWPSYQSAATSGLLYFGGTAICIVCIVLLHFNLRYAAARRNKARNDN